MLLALWLCIPVAFALAWYRLTGAAVLRHVGSLHFLLYFVAIYMGSYVLFVDGGEKNDIFIWSVMAYPPLALLGAMAAQATLKAHPFTTAATELRASRMDRRIVYSLLGFFTVLLGSYVAILGSETPLYVLVTQGPEEAQLARFSATKDYKDALGDIGLIVNLSRVFTDYFALFILVFEYCRARNGEVPFWRFWVMAFALAFAAFLFGERYPILKLIIYFSIALIAIRHRLLSLRLGLVLVLLGALVIPLTGLVHAATRLHFEYLSDFDIGFLLVWAWDVFADRAIGGQGIPLYQTFVLVPGVYDFFGGLTLSNPRGMFPYEQVQLPFLVFDSYAESQLGVQGSDPTAFFGEIYANFGVMTMLASMIGAGFLIQLVNSALSQAIERKRSMYFVSLHFMAMVYIADFAISFSTLYFDYRFFFLLLLFFLPTAAGLLGRQRYSVAA